MIDLGENLMLRTILMFGLAIALFGMTKTTHANEGGGILTVNSNLDVGDNNPGDGVCFIGFGFDLCTLRAAIEESHALIGPYQIDFDLSDNTTIEVVNGELLITKTLSIDASDVVNLDIEGNGNAPIFRVDAVNESVYFDNLTVSNTIFNTADGTGLLVETGSVDIEDSTFMQLSSIGCGAGMRVTGGSATVSTSAFFQNVTSNTGGAICSFGGDVTLDNTDVSVNSADSRAGAIFSWDANLSITDSTINNNLATLAPGEGGAIHVWQGSLTITGSLLDGNQAVEGGAIFALDADVTIDDSEITDNSASDNGGGIHHTEQTLTIANSTFHTNDANHGGGIDKVNGTLDLDSTTLHSNTAHHGGAIHATAVALFIDGGSINTNSVTGEGGGIRHTGGGSAEMNNVVMSTNASDSYGGGMFFGGGTLNADHVQWLGNQSGQGGGGLFASATGTLTNQWVDDNTAIRGGGMYVSGVTIDRSSFHANAATIEGGALALLGSATVQNSAIGVNWAANGGGIHVRNGTNTVIHTTIVDNTAPGQGGGIFVDESDTLHIYNSIVANNGNEDCYLDSDAFMLASGGNWASDMSCTGFSHEGFDPQLGAFVGHADMIGLGYMPTAGSPVLNEGSAYGCSLVDEHDQRGYDRDDGACDLGALELSATPMVITLASNHTEVTNNLSLVIILVTTLAGLTRRYTRGSIFARGSNSKYGIGDGE